MPQPAELEQPIGQSGEGARGAEGGQPRTIAAGEFKAKCLRLMDEVAETREAIVITKFGKPVAKLVPMKRGNVDIIGAMRGTVLWEGDILSPIDVEWDAMQ